MNRLRSRQFLQPRRSPLFYRASAEKPPVVSQRRETKTCRQQTNFTSPTVTHRKVKYAVSFRPFTAAPHPKKALASLGFCRESEEEEGTLEASSPLPSLLVPLFCFPKSKGRNGISPQAGTPRVGETCCAVCTVHTTVPTRSTGQGRE